MGGPPDVSVAVREQNTSHDASQFSLRGDCQRYSKGEIMTASPLSGDDPIKVGVIADQTGPLSIIGLANANVARMVIGDINAKGGLLGRHVALDLEDGATDDDVAAAAATKLVQDDRVDVIFGGIYSSTRQAIKGPAV